MDAIYSQYPLKKSGKSVVCVYVCPQMPTIHTPNPPVMGDSSHVHAGHSPGLASASLPSSDYCIIMMLGESKIVEDAIIDPTAPTPRLWYEITYNVGSNEARGSLFYSRILDSIVVKKAGETSSSMMVMMPNVLSVISIFFFRRKTQCSSQRLNTIKDVSYLKKQLPLVNCHIYIFWAKD